MRAEAHNGLTDGLSQVQEATEEQVNQVEEQELEANGPRMIRDHNA